MTLDDVRDVYRIDESELRQHLDIDQSIPMDKAIRDVKQTDRESIPSPSDIQTILADRLSRNDPAEGEPVPQGEDTPPAVTSSSIPERLSAPNDRRKVPSESDLIRGWMTLEYIRNMYGMEETEFRRLIGLPATISMDTPVRDLEMLGDETLPSTEDIRKIFASYTPAVTPQTYGKNRATASGGGRRSSPSTRPRGMGGRGRRQLSTGGLQTLRGSTTLQEAIAYSGKTLEQVKRDWNMSFVDPQTNLGTLARTLGVPMWELRAYFEK
jgi:hypothetical protein